MRARQALLLAGTTLLLAKASVGQPWERIGPDGGSICALAAAPAKPGVVYAGTGDFGGVFRSADRGRSWSFAGAGLGLRPACSLAVDATNPSRVWAVAYGRLFASANGGARWQPVSTPSSAGYLLAVAAHPTRSRVLLVSTVRQILRSTDGGKAWSSRPSAHIGAEVTRLVFDPMRPDRIFAATYAGVYRSRDGGETWRPANRGLPVTQRRVTALAVGGRHGLTLYAAAFGGLYQSGDGGDSWRPATAWSGQAITALAVAGRALYVGTGSGLYKSLDGARSFPAELRRLREQRVPAILVQPSGLLAGGELGLYRSTDGDLWQPSQSGLRARSFSHLQIDARAPANWYLIDPRLGVLRSHSGGAIWGRAGRELVDPAFGSWTTALAVDPEDSRVYAGVVGVEGGGLGVSADFGRSWQVDHPFRCVVPELVLPDGRRGRVYLRGEFLPPCGPPQALCYEWRSDDRGETFRCAGATLPPGGTYVALDAHSGTLFATSGAGLHRSADGSDTWTLLNADVHPVRLAISPADPDRLYTLVHLAGQELDLLRSLDGGATWTLASPGPRSAQARVLVADPLDADRVYALGAQSAFFSDDRGDTWQPLGESAGEVILTSLAFDPRAPELLYATSQGGGLMRLRLAR